MKVNFNNIKMVAHSLHGTLYVTICEVDKLSSPFWWNTICGKTQMSRGGGLLSQAKKLMLCQPEIVGSKLYATIDLDRARVGRTRTVEHDLKNPRWNESFHVHCAHVVNNVVFTLKDDDPVSATLIGRAFVPAGNIASGEQLDRWVNILDETRTPLHGAPRIRVLLRFVSVTRDPNWSRGVASPDYGGVRRTFFRQRSGCNVSLYQDAHVLSDTIIKVLMDGNEYYANHRCWEDVFHAIDSARHLIYIAGWSVHTKITLLRDPHRETSPVTLGELLKRKADQGVRVLVLVWDDRTSLGPLRKEGLMATHDQETANYFRYTKVHCVLCPRIPPSRGKSVLQKLQISAVFTHHQKTIVVDSDDAVGGSGKRRIVSFVGGIDLCDGRYDTQEHSLFGTLGTTHQNDFHQPNFRGASIRKGGPREPWHDIHCRLEGPVAWDVLYNFEQRWIKQVGADKIVPIAELYKFLTRPSPALAPDNRDSWNVQLFRSIDGGVTAGFPDDPERASLVGLVSGKDAVIERSIQDGYIEAIRRAQNFIYIENQYFLGSSFSWKPDPQLPKPEDVGALHLIPKELSLKIASKIEAGERFAVYVVIPMWPEGEPESASVQAILDWQRRTMEMMYADVAAAIRRKGLSDAHPRDYLTFFCLGKQEKPQDGEYEPPESPEPGTDYARAQRSRRFMIYVHAKMMIVDDEYIMVGSANINQRSMDGGRDSEIAMGAYQPHHLALAGHPARGQIYGFRLALWWEHLKVEDETFQCPETLKCVNSVNEIAYGNWNSYANGTFDDNHPGHLLRYPVEVTHDGKVCSLTTAECFPDTNAPVLGTKSNELPAILTI